MHTFSSPVKEDDPLFSSPVKEDAITSLTRSVFPREISFPTKVPSPTKSCLPQRSSYLQDICFPSGVISRHLFPQRSSYLQDICFPSGVISRQLFSPVDHLILPSVIIIITCIH